MAARKFVNNAPQLQIQAVNSSATSLVLASGTFAGWPASFPFTATLEIGTANAEVVLVTNIAGTTATVTRGYNSTTAVSHSAGATIDHTAVALDYQEANDHVNGTSNVHGVTSQVVGKDDVQTLTNKTIKSQAATTTAGTPVITATAAAGGDKLWSGKNASATETSNIKDDGSATLKGAVAIGSAGQWTVDASGNVTTSGTLTASGAVSATKGSGTGLAVTANATVGGTLTVGGSQVVVGHANGLAIEAGTATVTFSASPIATATVNFATAFNTAPVVTIDIQPFTNNTPVDWGLTGTTTTGFTYYAKNPSGANLNGTVTLRFIAVGT